MRPTKYSEEMLEKTEEYLESGYSVIPSVAGLAVYLGVVTKTLYNWSGEHEEFLHALEQLKDKQHEKLVDCGLVGEFNSTITKLILTKHGYSDRQESTVQGPDGGPVVIERKIIDP